VTTPEGRLVWIIDGYTRANRILIRVPVGMQNLGRFKLYSEFRQSDRLMPMRRCAPLRL